MFSRFSGQEESLRRVVTNPFVSKSLPVPILVCQRDEVERKATVKGNVY